MRKYTKSISKRLCRELRKNQTRSEPLLWNELRNRKSYGKKFLRQFPIFYFDISGRECFYIADFYCHEQKLIIELDGKNHRFREAFDESRTDILESMGLKVIRYRNEEIEADVRSILTDLQKVLEC